jgi:hypothetical protein
LIIIDLVVDNYLTNKYVEIPLWSAFPYSSTYRCSRL